MAKFTADAGIDFTNFKIEDLGTGSPTIHESKHYRLAVDTDNFNDFFGTGFAYNAQFDLVSGTLNEIAVVEGAVELYDVSGFSMAVTTAEKFHAKNDSQGFLAALFAGADAITGSTVADTLLGFNGNDTIDGGDGKDSLSGGAGNDSLIGGKGDDSMDGGAGNDTYVVDSGADVAAESGAGGIDTVQSSATAYTLGANIENLILTGLADINGTGNTLANVITGNTGKNVLSGDVGNDKLIGGDGADTLSGGGNNDTLDGGIGDDSLDGGKGDDSMAGGAGNDIYVVDSLKDKVTESLADDKGGGTDTVLSSAGSFVLGTNVDDLELVGKGIGGTGNALDNKLTGNGENNSLSGLGGADTIDGGAGNDTLDGGSGDDSMVGGEGNDVYIQDSAGDKIADSGTADGDELRTNLDTVTNAIAGIEHYTFTGTKTVTFTGDAADNKITGTAAADKLDGAAGDDTVSGLGGNDTLTGGADNDRLVGGMGADSMDGGLGDDTYGIDNAGDTIADSGGTHDKVEATISIDLGLPKFAQIEDATLLGTGALNLIGSTGANILTGNAGANKLDGGTGDDTMDGGKGNDTYFIDIAGKDQVSEDDLGGTGGGTDAVFSEASFTLGANIENLTLLNAAVTGTGNELKNTITGNDGNNTLDGGADIDKLIGGKGDDTYFVDNAKDVVTESTAGPPGGKDTVNSSDSFILGANVENLNLTGNNNSSGTGNALDNAITGDGTSNTLFGLAGADKLDGGAGNDTLDGGAGIDDLTGGAGNDTYVLDSKNDAFHEDAGDSGDTVAAPFNIDLNDKAYDNIENATLLGTAALTATGDDGNNYLTGNSGANTLTGGDGLDTLDGKGGVDSLDGGKGNDVYYADNAGEKIFDTGGDAKDEVRASVTFTLGALVTIENAMLLGIAALNLSGNAIDNVLTGNDGANKIDGVDGNDSVAGAGGNDTLTGGTGSDTLAGGKGDDVYVVDGGETILENDKEGIDTVQSAISYSIAAIANVENLTLTGTLAIGGTGNSGNNVINGNSNQNTLDGGAGADTMAGGMGNDTYTVDDIGDKVNEAANAGIDTVLSSLPSYILPANVENLTLTGIGDINGTGNTLGNLITGNDGKNVLDGGSGNDTLAGGLGNDELNGGAGADTYVYASKDVPDTVHTGDTGGKGVDHVSIVGNPFDWDTRRDVNDLLIQVIPDEAGEAADFDPNQTIRIVDQYAGAGIAFFSGDFGKDFNLFYGDNPNLTTVFTPSGLTGKDQGHNAEVVEGTSGNDTVNGGGGQSDFLYGNDGNDQVTSQSAADEFAFLAGGLGNDTLTGSAGTDHLRGDEGDDVLDGGAGPDRADYRLASGAVHVDLTLQGQAQAVGADQGKDTLINIEDLRGSNFNDTLSGDSHGNTLIGLVGDDSINGGGGSDFLRGAEGNDTLAAAALADFTEVSYSDAKTGAIVNLTDVTQGAVAAHTAQDGLGGVDTLINIAGALGGDFADKFFGGDADEFFEPGGGDDTIDGGLGFDDIDYFSSSDAVIASLALQGGAQFISTSQGSDTFTNMEGLDGSAFNDTLNGDVNGNFLQGRAGNDSLFGGDGGDRLRGGTGNDILSGGSGEDEVDYFAATSGVHVDLGKQSVAQVISKDEGSDTLISIEDARGSNFNDTLIGDAGFNNLTGLAGNDSLNGGAGFDILIGGAGNDILNGGPLGDFDAASYVDAQSGIIANLSSVAQFGVAAHSASDSLGGIDKFINIGGIIGSDSGDTMVGGSAYEFFEGQGGNDSIDGGSEFNALEYFDSTDAVKVDLSHPGTLQNISVSQGTDTFVNISDVFGSFFNDTIIGNGDQDVLEGRDGDDKITVLNDNFFRVFGDAGTDRLIVGGSFVSISHQDVFDKIFGIEEIDLGTGHNNLTLTAQDVLEVSDTHVMQILGNNSDSVSSIAQDWTKGVDQVIGSDTYHTYTSSQPGSTVTLLVDADINQTIT